MANSEQIAQYFAQVAQLYESKGFTKLDIFLDRNATHKTKMQNLFKDFTCDLKIETHFHLMAAYSPKLNLVEYLIHLIRQKVLHHADPKTNLEAFENRIKAFCQNQKIISKEQIINILEHIENLVPKL